METLHDEKHCEHGDEPRAEVLAKNREGKARLRHGVPRTLDQMLWSFLVRISGRHAPFQGYLRFGRSQSTEEDFSNEFA